MDPVTALLIAQLVCGGTPTSLSTPLILLHQSIPGVVIQCLPTGLKLLSQITKQLSAQQAPRARPFTTAPMKRTSRNGS